MVKPPREAEAPHPLRIRVAHLPRPGSVGLWTLECLRSSILVRPSRLLHRTGDYIEGGSVDQTFATMSAHITALSGADLRLAPATRMKDATCRAPPAPTSVQNLHSHCTSLPAAPLAPGRRTTVSAVSPTCLTSDIFVAGPRPQGKFCFGMGS